MPRTDPIAGCKCDDDNPAHHGRPSCEELRRRQRRRSKMRDLYGSTQVIGEPFEVIRERIIEFHARGMAFFMMAELTGVPRRTIQRINNGQCGRVSSETYSRLARLRFTAANPRTKLDPTVTTRKLQALNALGLPHRFIARSLDSSNQHINALIQGKHRNTNGYKPFTTFALAEAVNRLYEDLAYADPLPAFDRRSVNNAIRKHYAPPVCWPDDTIEDLDAEPDWSLNVDVDGLSVMTPRGPADLAVVERAFRGERQERVGHGERYLIMSRMRYADVPFIAAALGIDDESANRALCRFRTASKGTQ